MWLRVCVGQEKKASLPWIQSIKDQTFSKKEFPSQSTEWERHRVECDERPQVEWVAIQDRSSFNEKEATIERENLHHGHHHHHQSSWNSYLNFKVSECQSPISHHLQTITSGKTTSEDTWSGSSCINWIVWERKWLGALDHFACNRMECLSGSPTKRTSSSSGNFKKWF